MEVYNTPEDLAYLDQVCLIGVGATPSPGIETNPLVIRVKMISSVTGTIISPADSTCLLQEVMLRNIKRNAGALLVLGLGRGVGE